LRKGNWEKNGEGIPHSEMLKYAIGREREKEAKRRESQRRDVILILVIVVHSWQQS